jgi:hypothetical protein
MTSPHRGFVDPVRCALIAVLAFALPSAAFAQSSDSTPATAADSVKNLPLSAAERLSYVGKYSVSMPNGQSGPARVFEERGVLKMQPDDSPSVPLLYQGEHRFRPEGIPDFLIVFVLEDGKPTKFTVQKDDGLMVGVRVP